MPRKKKRDNTQPLERFCFVPPPLVVKKARSKRPKAHRPFKRHVSNDVLRLCLAELGNAPRALLVLSSVSREMWRLIRHNHALLSHVFLHTFYWNHGSWNALLALSPPHRGAWKPLRSWEIEGVPVRERTFFNAYIYRMLVMRFARHCSACGSTAFENECTPIWVLGLRLCPVCLRDNLISHRALWLDYGIWVGASLPERTNAVSLAIEESHSVRRTLFDALKTAVYMFVDHSNTTTRRRLTSHPADLVGRGRHMDTLFMWRPHLVRVLRLDKARAVMPLRVAAANALKAYVRQRHVQHLLHNGPRETAMERLMGRDLRPAGSGRTGCYFEPFALRTTGDTLAMFRAGINTQPIGWKPHHGAPLRRAWAPLSFRERGLF